MLVSIIIRALNEARHLPSLLEALREQQIQGFDVEVVLVDSGSIDETVEIATQYGAKITNISKADFTFGRSLNQGCATAEGEILVFISGHCVPCNSNWLAELIKPILDGIAVYSYGRQVGNSYSKFSECQLLKKYFPDTSKIPQRDFFVNNANSALAKSVWMSYRFDEVLTGLEDMDLGRRLVNAGLKVAYVAEAPVYHLHDESWGQVKRRYEREAIALQRIMPEVHLSFGDFLRFFISSVLLDIGVALQERKLHVVLIEIVLFRFMQFWGAYRGNHIHRMLSREAKYRYFYPK